MFLLIWWNSMGSTIALDPVDFFVLPKNTFLKIFSFVFCRRRKKEVIQVWKDMTMIFWWTIPLKMSVLNNINNCNLCSNLGDYTPPIERLTEPKTFEPMLPLAGCTWSPGSLTSDDKWDRGDRGKAVCKMFTPHQSTKRFGGGKYTRVICVVLMKFAFWI